MEALAASGAPGMPKIAADVVFDGHNDVLLRLFRKGNVNAAHDFITGDGEGQLDLPRMLKGRMGGGMFAIFIPSDDKIGKTDTVDAEMSKPAYDVPLPRLMTSDQALPAAMAMAAILFRIERASAGKFKVCRTAAEIRTCLAAGVVAAVLHIEGAEPIDASLHNLDVLHEAGLRSIGPVWSRPTIFGHGVPFRFPSTGDIGPGLTDLGRALVRACDERCIAIDLSHLNEKGFWDVAKLTRKPLIATHSNAHAVCPHSRNLTDKQLAAIAETKGIVGLNFATSFLNPDGGRRADTPLEVMLRHLDHLVEKVGIDHVGLGSDFDGAMIPRAIGDAAGLPNLTAAIRRHGYDDATLAKLTHGNWLAVLERTWGG
jgi:membrane dipeptidase